MSRISITSLLLAFFISFSSLVCAHPHIFIDAHYAAKIENDSVKRLEAVWFVDDFTTSSIMMGYDLNQDGDITGQEKVELLTAFDSFSEQGYFLKLEVDGAPIYPQKVKIVDLLVRDARFWLRLEIDLQEAVKLDNHTLSVAFGDDTMYTALTPDNGGLLQLSGEDAENCTPIIRESDVVTIDSWVDLRCSP